MQQLQNPVVHAEAMLKQRISNISQLCGGSNVIFYASGFLQKPEEQKTLIAHEDMNGIMNVVHDLQCDKGLVFILHTPGGDPSAAASIAEYLQFKFPRITARSCLIWRCPPAPC